jgi:hypothetical protein
MCSGLLQKDIHRLKELADENQRLMRPVVPSLDNQALKELGLESRSPAFQRTPLGHLVRRGSSLRQKCRMALLSGLVLRYKVDFRAARANEAVDRMKAVKKKHQARRRGYGASSERLKGTE